MNTVKLHGANFDKGNFDVFDNFQQYSQNLPPSKCGNVATYGSYNDCIFLGYLKCQCFVVKVKT